MIIYERKENYHSNHRSKSASLLEQVAWELERSSKHVDSYFTVIDQSLPLHDSIENLVDT